MKKRKNFNLQVQVEAKKRDLKHQLRSRIGRGQNPLIAGQNTIFSQARRRDLDLFLLIIINAVSDRLLLLCLTRVNRARSRSRRRGLSEDEVKSDGR